jgi:hypothetical protein
VSVLPLPTTQLLPIPYRLPTSPLPTTVRSLFPSLSTVASPTIVCLLFASPDIPAYQLLEYHVDTDNLPPVKSVLDQWVPIIESRSDLTVAYLSHDITCRFIKDSRVYASVVAVVAHLLFRSRRDEYGDVVRARATLAAQLQPAQSTVTKPHLRFTRYELLIGQLAPLVSASLVVAPLTDVPSDSMDIPSDFVLPTV